MRTNIQTKPGHSSLKLFRASYTGRCICICHKMSSIHPSIATRNEGSHSCVVGLGIIHQMLCAAPRFSGNSKLHVSFQFVPAQTIAALSCGDSCNAEIPLPSSRVVPVRPIAGDTLLVEYSISARIVSPNPSFVSQPTVLSMTNCC